MRAALVAGGLGLLAVGLSIGPVRADDAPGSGFGIFSLQANAPGIQVVTTESSGTCFRNYAADNGCEGVVPQAVSTLRSGPVGHGLAAVAWPGTIAAGAGSLLITVGGDKVPPQAAMLNDPVRADAYTNVGKPTQSNDTVPGSTMTATALPSHVSADAELGQSTVLAVATAGSTQARSSVDLTGPSAATATSHSEVKNVDIAGVLHIGSVVSDATATTDGTTAAAHGVTTASGITVDGVAVTIDDNGVHVAGQGTGTGSEQATVNSALSRAGIQVALGAPQGKPKGGSVTYNAQSLVVVLGEPGLTTTVVLGGANVSVAASPGFSFSVPGTPPLSAGVPAVQPVGSTLAPPAQSLPLTAPGQTPVVNGAVAPVAQAAYSPPDPGPVKTRWVLLVLGGALLMAGLLRRLPTDVLGPVQVEWQELR